MAQGYPSGGYARGPRYGAGTIVAIVLILLLVVALIWLFMTSFAPFATPTAEAPTQPGMGSQGAIPTVVPAPGGTGAGGVATPATGGGGY